MPPNPHDSLTRHATAPRSSTVQWVVWGVLALTLAAVTFGFIRSRLRSPLLASLPLQYPVPNFTLTNQHGQAVSLADLKGNVWVADMVFTRCAGPCPTMTKRMAELQSQLESTPAKLVTLTTDPDHDTTGVMREFGERFGADFKRWHFLTGSKEEIVNLAVKGLKLTALPKAPAEQETPSDLFIHSELFVVVDKQGRLRGAFESYQPDAVATVGQAVRQLLRER